MSPAPAPPCRRRYRRLVDGHFRGSASVAAERDLRAHLVTCPGCRGYYDRHLGLSQVDPAAMPSRERLARGLGLAAAGHVRWAGWLAPAAAIGLSAALVLALTQRSSGPEPRGALQDPGSQLLVYEVARDRPPRQAVAEIARGSALAFAYANIGRKQRLSVFAVDERRRVYWYHPAWLDLADNPEGVRIATDDAIHEIPQVVYHRLDGSRVRVFGVFADRAISVRELEAAVSRVDLDGQGMPRLTLPDAQTTQIDLHVEGP